MYLLNSYPAALPRREPSPLPSVLLSLINGRKDVGISSHELWTSPVAWSPYSFACKDFFPSYGLTAKDSHRCTIVNATLRLLVTTPLNHERRRNERTMLQSLTWLQCCPAGNKILKPHKHCKNYTCKVIQHTAGWNLISKTP